MFNKIACCVRVNDFKTRSQVTEWLDEKGCCCVGNGSHGDTHINFSNGSYIVDYKCYVDCLEYDCGINIPLFKALVTYKIDDDKDQWFIDGDGVMEQSSDEPSKYMMLNGRKATIEELIKNIR